MGFPNWRVSDYGMARRSVRTLDAVLYKGQTMPGKNRFPAVLQPIAFSCKDYGADALDDLSPTLRAMGHNSSHANAGGQAAVATELAVRRLMSVECERLQGFEDRHTLVPIQGKPAKDGPRYKLIGNSVATRCMAWIGRRILWNLAVQPAIEEFVG